MQSYAQSNVHSISVRSKQLASLLLPREVLNGELYFTSIERKHPYTELEKILNLGQCIAFILDIRTRQYEFVSSNVNRLLGYSPQEFLERDLSFIKKLIHPHDLPYVCKLQQKVWRFLLKLPPEQHHCFSINCHFRLRKADGRYVHLLEQSTVYQADRKGNITHLLIMGTNITYWNEVGLPAAAILSPSGETYFDYTSSQEQLCANLTKRECEIMQLLAEGYSSKQIAIKLSISLHTVNTHRKRMIEKTKSKNTSELVQLGISKGWI